VYEFSTGNLYWLCKVFELREKCRISQERLTAHQRYAGTPGKFLLSRASAV